MRNILVDSRWAGDSGIGRMYHEIMSRAPSDIGMFEVGRDFPLGSMLSPWHLAREIKEADSCGLFYSPSFMPPLYSKIPYIITIHDLMHLFYYSRWHKLYYEQVIARLARRAAGIITVSHFSKGQLVDLLGIDAHRITVIYNGVDGRFKENNNTHSLGRPYFLYIGNRRKNKNIPRMLEGFARAKIPKDFLFALSGAPDPVLQQLIEKLGIANRVIFLGFIEEEDLPAVYKGAFATCYASLMEGFGLPILESMASGTPVITSNTSSLPEVAGGAALTINPLQTVEVANAMETLVNDGQLRGQLESKGRERASSFGWEDTATNTWQLIKACLR